MSKTKSITKPNLLINGDFQINKKGQTLYTNNQNVRTYGLDMWASYVDNEVTVNYYPIENGGVRIQGDGISSFLFQEPPHIKDGKNHMLMLDVSLTKQEGTFQFGIYNGSDFILKDAHDGINVFDLGTADIERACILTTGNVDITCNYIYLYEGNTEIEHQKEDYSIALLRTQDYVRTVSFTVMTYIAVNYAIIQTHLLSAPMKAKPTINLMSKSSEGNVKGVSLDILNDNQSLILTIEPISEGNMAIYSYKYILSCEPL